MLGACGLRPGPGRTRLVRPYEPEALIVWSEFNAPFAGKLPRALERVLHLRLVKPCNSLNFFR